MPSQIRIRTLNFSNVFRVSRKWIAVAILAGALGSVRAAEETAIQTETKEYLPWEKGSVKFGGFIAAFNSDIGFGVNSLGVTLNAEDLLGLDSSLTVFRGEAMYRPGKSRRNQIDFTYASYHRRGSATLEQEITIGGETFPVGAQLESIFNFDIIRGTYSYAILQDDRMRIALGLGVYALPLEYGLTVETTSGTSRVEGGDTTLPLPAFALRGEFQLIPKLFLNAGIDAMYLEISSFKGSLLDVNLALEYRPWKHFGFGVGYNSLNIAVEGEAGSDYPGIDFIGSVDVSYAGLMLYGKVSF
jgi:hypothetical protein